MAALLFAAGAGRAFAQASALPEAPPENCHTFFCWTPKFNLDLSYKTSTQELSSSNSGKVTPTIGGTTFGTKILQLDLASSYSHSGQIVQNQNQVQDIWNVTPRFTVMASSGVFAPFLEYGYQHSYTRTTAQPVKVVDSGVLGFGLTIYPTPHKNVGVSFEYQNNLRGGSSSIISTSIGITLKLAGMWKDRNEIFGGSAKPAH